MVAITAPIRLHDLPMERASFVSSVATAQLAASLNEAEDLIERLPAAHTSFKLSIEDALAKARRLRRLGIAPDLTEAIRSVRDTIAYYGEALSAADVVGHALAASGGEQGTASGSAISASMRQSRDLVAEIKEELQSRLKELEKEQARPVPPEHEAPIGRALLAYGAALRSALAPFGVGAITPDVADVLGDFIPVLRVDLANARDVAAVIDCEQIAHTAVEALDPSLMGIFAIEYVWPETAA